MFPIEVLCCFIAADSHCKGHTGRELGVLGDEVVLAHTATAIRKNSYESLGRDHDSDLIGSGRYDSKMAGALSRNLASVVQLTPARLLK
jgi:hypothetical protein